MVKARRTHKNLFLLELLISIALFMLLLIVGLLFFLKAHLLTQKASLLHEAVNLCENTAACYENSSGEFSSLTIFYEDAVLVNDKLYIYFDDEYNHCAPVKGKYYILVKPLEKKDGLSSVSISFYTDDTEVVHEINAYHYKNITTKEERP